MQVCEGTGRYSSDTRHEGIAFVDGQDCPLCEALAAKLDLQEKLTEAKDDLSDANNKLQELDLQIESLDKQIEGLKAEENVNER